MHSSARFERNTVNVMPKQLNYYLLHEHIKNAHKKNYRRHWWRWKRLQKLLLFRLKNGYNQIEFATYTSSDFSHFTNLYYIFPFSLTVPIISILPIRTRLPIENFLTPMYTLCFSNFLLFLAIIALESDINFSTK